MELRIDAQRLDRINKGTNFLNLAEREEGKKYYINVFLETSLNLKDKRETLSVESNLPSCSYRGGEVISFLNELKEYVKLPYGKIFDTNRKDNNKVSHYNLGLHTRDTEVRFEDIEFDIGELAEKKLQEMDLDIKEEVKKILGEQEEDKQKQIDAFVQLKEKIEILKNLIGSKSYGYGYNQEKDNTIKILLSPEEYNSKLKEIEKKMIKLEKEFNIQYPMRFEYIKTEEEQAGTFETWFKENEEELREQFESGDSEEMTFDEYAEMCYTETE